MTSYITVRAARSHSHLPPPTTNTPNPSVYPYTSLGRANAQGLLCVPSRYVRSSLNRWFSFPLTSSSCPALFYSTTATPSRSLLLLLLSNWRKLVQTRPFMLRQRRNFGKLRETWRARSNLSGTLNYNAMVHWIPRSLCNGTPRYAILLLVLNRVIKGKGYVGWNLCTVHTVCTKLMKAGELRQGICPGNGTDPAHSSQQCQFNWRHLIWIAPGLHIAEAKNERSASCETKNSKWPPMAAPTALCVVHILFILGKKISPRICRAPGPQNDDPGHHWLH